MAFSKVHTVKSIDGVNLAVTETGNPNGFPVLLLHGTCCSHHIWKSQLHSAALANACRIIAPDLRGHGDSDKPNDSLSYAQSQFWADDLKSILDYFGLEHVVVVAWSYGGRVINDYLLCYGQDKIAGINFIAAGTLSINSVKGPKYELLAQLFSDSPSVRQEAETQFASELCGGDESTAFFNQVIEDIQKTSFNTRISMRDREMNYENVLAELSIPVLLTHGKKDDYSLPLLTELLSAHIPNSVVSWYDEEVHLPFLTCPTRFNEELLAFVLKASTL